MGFRKEYRHSIILHRNPLSRESRNSPEIQSCSTRWGNPHQLLELLARNRVGTWFYAGWIDQAALHVGTVCTGGTELFSELFGQIDDDRVDQIGDMLVGFNPLGDDWLFCIETENFVNGFSISVRTNSDSFTRTIKELVQLEDNT